MEEPMEIEKENVEKENVEKKALSAKEIVTLEGMFSYIFL